MKLFLNLITVMLLVTWTISYFVLQIGSVAHMILLMAIFIAVANMIREGLHTWHRSHE